MATRDNIYKQMGSQRTKANLYRAGYRKTKAALQEQEKINAAMATSLAAQNTMAPAQAIVAPSKVYQPNATQAQTVQQQQVTEVPNPTTPVTQTPGPSTAGNVQNPQGTVRYIRIPAGVTRATYNLRPAISNNVTATNTPTVGTATPVTTGRGKNNFSNGSSRQGPPTPGNVATPKTTSTTTVVRKGKGRGKKTSTLVY